MKDDRLLEDRDLADAFRSVRDAYDGTNADSNVTLQRALFRTRVHERRQRVTRWVVLPIAAVLVASTAWAGVTGKLAPAMHSVLESFHAEHAPPSVGAPAPSTVTPSASAVAESTVPPEPSPSSAAPEPTAVPTERTADPPVVSPSITGPVKASPQLAVAKSALPPERAPAPVATAMALPPSEPAPSPPSNQPAPAPSASDPHAALFAEAHRLHFTDRDPARALPAWDRYLAAAPNGRFAPEARYNRALALVRLGRHREATVELDAFAKGTYGSYRRDEARALLDALARDAGHP